MNAILVKTSRAADCHFLTAVSGAAIALTLTASLACSSRDMSALSVAVVDSAGVQIVTSSAPQWKQGEGWRVDSVPYSVIGDDESQKKEHFEYIPQLWLRLSDGRILIADGEPSDLRLFSAEGVFVKSIAPPGSGPGEFRYIFDLIRYPGDTVVVRGDRKVTWFSPDGALIREEKLLDACDSKNPGKSSLWCMQGIFPDGSSYYTGEDSTIPETATNRKSVRLANGLTSPGPGLYRRLSRVYVVPAARDSVHRAGVMGQIEQYGIDMGGGSTVFVAHPFFARGYHAAGGTPPRIAIANNPDYEIQIWNTAGRLERIVRRSNGRRVPTAAEEAAVKEELSRRYGGRVPIERIMAEVQAPDSIPAVMGLVIGNDGELLVLREGWLAAQQHALVDVFDADGRFLGELRLPRRSTVFELGADFILLARLDDNDVPRVESYRLHR